MPVRMTPGHVLPWERDETALPGPWGFYRNLRVGTFGPSAEPCVLADEYTLAEYAGERAEYPYRSAEYDPAAKAIKGVAILKRDPALDLGIVCYADNVTYLYAEAGMSPMGPSNAAPPAQVGAPAGNAAATDTYSPEEEAQYARMCNYMRMKYSLCPEWPGAAKEPEQPTQPTEPTEPPASGKKDGEGEPDGDEGKDKKEPPVMNSNPADVVLYQKQVADLTARAEKAEKEAAAAAAKVTESECRAVLYSLVAEGFQLSKDQYAKELGKLTRLPAAERPERLAELRLMYANQQVPSAQRVELYQDANPVETVPGPEQVQYEFDQAVLLYIRQHPGTKAEEAEAAVRAARK